MDAILKKIQVNPAKRDKEGDITGPAAAIISVEVPLDGEKQQQEVTRLFEILTQEWIKVDIKSAQITLQTEKVVNLTG
ncbi:hypothetical protein H8E77_01840 [bacterium]|nr:hypothetical protein [bacterium]